jgi:hypothetical protein
LDVVVPDTKHNDFSERFDKLQEGNHGYDFEAVKQMSYFNILRNKVEYDNYILSQRERENINKAYADIEGWTGRLGYYKKAAGLLEEIEG